MNKFLNILAWLLFALSIVSYTTTDTFSNEPLYLVLSGIFCIAAPRKL